MSNVVTTRDDSEEVLGALTQKIAAATAAIAKKYDWNSFSTNSNDQLAFRYAVTVRDFLNPYMRNQSLLKAEMGNKIRVKGTDNTTYVVDYVGGQVLDIMLDENIKAGKEKGWSKFDEEDEQFIHIGEGPRKRIITDPFDNTTFGMVGYRDCNVAVCLADEQNKFLNCCVADLQTDAVYFANNQGTWLYYVTENDRKIVKHSPLKVATKKDLKESFLIIPTFTMPRRGDFTKAPLCFEKVKIFNMGGPLSISRLAEGTSNTIHGYLDYFECGGQPIYEILYFPLAIMAGAHVTGIDGKPFDFTALLNELEKNSKARYKFVAACTKELHGELMAKIK